MKTEAKSAAILLATLALGVVLGMVGQGLLMRERARQVRELRTEPGFVSLVEDVIQPRAEQQAAVRAILDESARRYDSVVRASRADVGLVLDSMKRRLAPILDERQRERLSRMAQVPEPDRPPPRPGEKPREPGPPRDDRPRDAGPARSDRPGPGSIPPDDRPRPDGAGDRPPPPPPPR